MIITNELLSIVLDNQDISVIDVDNNNVYYYGNVPNEGDFINIYELAHKCKEWALNQNIISINGHYLQAGYIQSGWHRGHCKWTAKVDQIIGSEGMGFRFEAYQADTEPEAIFQACQWILDNTKLKG